MAREITLKHDIATPTGYMKGRTAGSCIILSSLSAEVQVRYGDALTSSEPLSRGQTMVLPAELGDYCLEGTGTLVFSYVPARDDVAWRRWEDVNIKQAAYEAQA